MPVNADTSIGLNPVITLREISKETVIAICKLSDTLSPAQKKIVAPNAQSIAQAYYNKHFWFRAIYADEVPVGFLMLYDSPEEQPEAPMYFLWRLMIAGPYQGLGYGKKAVQLLIEYVRGRPRAKELLVSFEDEPGSPEGFYTKLGFKRTEKMQDIEVIFSLPLA